MPIYGDETFCFNVYSLEFYPSGVDQYSANLPSFFLQINGSFHMSDSFSQHYDISIKMLWPS